MKVVILAGGYGTRISEESHLKPKPMLEIGGKPILWHIMKIYSQFGFNDFIICLGYKAYVIKEYFANYYLHESDVSFDFRKENQMEIHGNTAEPWRVTLVNTGLETMTGSRVKKIQKYVGSEPFFLTYGDGVSDVNILELYEFHKKQGKIATVTAIQPSGRWGSLDIDANHIVKGFKEKPKGDGGWINGGFFVLENSFFDYISDRSDDIVLEKEPLEALAKEGQLSSFQHEGFWQAMDTLRDKNHLEDLWKENNAPWKVWH
ncbi:glucose-1-phosphate cytidylyltransferase [Leptospira ilyithenensis]|uniref:Glucose-1-phosphate cytidylyltransferase n=1 Tax=Leptospira ilyithenensis TaxID=2484901 RepID=A0A4R9LMD3_9LEPT|nr:glucose-1-phosphate cytidylyltransferase [Leptospira ilyithenensis]TGN08023.1 glucose-1-phosphate cytidylyltransferase [Leptospira ilyithenensis]